MYKCKIFNRKNLYLKRIFAYFCRLFYAYENLFFGKIKKRFPAKLKFIENEFFFTMIIIEIFS